MHFQKIFLGLNEAASDVKAGHISATVKTARFVYGNLSCANILEVYKIFLKYFYWRCQK